ncbi:hypothetical protein W02_20700 [Nitrospira sp. KM1]|nr:hypothetical protein W02_20700 [Nitrospira sp. KM1]
MDGSFTLPAWRNAWDIKGLFEQTFRPGFVFECQASGKMAKEVSGQYAHMSQQWACLCSYADGDSDLTA